MGPTRAQRLREIFDSAAELAGVARADFVRAACAGDASLEAEVMQLLRAVDAESTPLDVEPESWLHQTASGGDADPLGPALSQASDVGELSGLVIGDYRLVRLLGRGGVGTVYQAEQVSLGRPVAIKLLHSWTATGEARRRFVGEAATLARLKHPDVAQVIDAGAHQLDLGGADDALAERVFGDLRSLPWISMELVEGARPIVEACRGMSVQAILALFVRVANAVHYGHQQGIIHRDLKPANILINSRGEPKVIDFGIARTIGADAGTSSSRSTTLAGFLVGSPSYMSPEQCDGSGAPIDTRSDVHALGVVLYESLTGALPYTPRDDSLAATARAIGEQQPADPRKRRPDLPADAAIVILKALSKSPADRYQSAAEFAADLRRVLDREPILARRPSSLYAATMLVRRRPLAASLAIIALLGVAAAFVGISIGLARERVARRAADRAAWLANLTAADLSISRGDGGTAVRKLNAIPPSTRGWEWNYLVAASDRSIECWDLDGVPAGAYLAPSGRWISGHWDDGRVRFTDLTTGAVIDHREPVSISGTTRFSSDESLVAILMPKQVRVFDLNKRTVVRQIAIEPAASSSEKAGFPLGAAFSPDKRLLAIGLAEAHGVAVYDLSTGQRVFARTSPGWTYQPAFTPDGRTLVWADPTALQAVDTATWQTIASIPIERASGVEPGGVTQSPDGRTIAVFSGIFVQLVDLQTKAVRVELRGHAQRVHTINFDAAGDRAVSTSADRTVRVWDARSGRLLCTFVGHEKPTGAAAFDASTNAMTVTSIDGGARARRWDTRFGGLDRSVRLDGEPGYVHQLFFEPSEPIVRAAMPGATASLDLRTPQSPGDARKIDAVDVCVIPGRGMQVVNRDRRHLALVDTATGRQVWQVDAPSEAHLAASPDGRLLSAQESADRLAIYRVEDGQRVSVIAGEGVTRHPATFSPDGRLIFVAAVDGSRVLYNAASGVAAKKLADAGDRGFGVAFSADGALIAFCHDADGVTVADARTFEPVARIDNVGGRVWSIAISPDKTRLAVGSQDRIIHLFDLPTGDELMELRQHTGTVMALAWSADGRYLASGGYDQRVIVYDSKPERSQTPLSADSRSNRSVR